MKKQLERIRQRQRNLNFGLAAQYLLALPFLIIGWAAGFIWWVISFWINSFIEGWMYWWSENDISG